MFVNEQDLLGYETDTFNNMNSIDTALPVGFSVFTDRSCNDYTNTPSGGNDGNEIILNSNSLGVIGTPDSVANEFTEPDCSGSRGHFYYQNQTLYGLNDDVPNSTMDGADALADISSYLVNPNDPIDLLIEHTKNFPSPGNPNIHMIFPFAYTTPCDTFSTQIIADTAVCSGDSLQLFASGGSNYEWLNTAGMDAPNSAMPTVSPDSSQLYVVSIENTTQNATDYEWYIDDGFWDNTTHISAYFDTAGVYSVKLYAYNNLPECLDSASFNIVVNDTIYARIPNIITPNDDATNDTFTIDLRRVKEIEAHFFNRWGNEVNNSVQKSNGLQQTISLWNGKTLQNEKVTEGTYFYTIRITSVANKEYDFHGHVQVSY